MGTTTTALPTSGSSLTSLQEQCLRIAVRNQPGGTPFRSHAALLMSAEWCSWVQFEMRIDPHIASLQLLCDFVGTLNVAGPDRSPKAVESIVRFHDRFFVCTEAQNRKDGA
jgi:hypothetical protein